ncbi:MAG TPA: Na+/H+ antiporter NhaA [Miltoncostaeaceae bacterium]|nr:Na+/H+ antiporter NhaA [Miltoncostaeaceae bacterium]
MTSDAPPQRPRRPWSRTERPVPRLVVRPLEQFFRLEASGGLVLLGATVVALIWANVAGAAYEDFWTTPVTIEVGDWQLDETVRDLVNDGLMAVFFLVIGLEVKRELAVGELSTIRAALLPAVAAVGGMVVPALVFLALVGGGDGARGWGIPMATDVAFALGALAALGRRVPPGLVAFLLGAAVIDDIGAIVVIAVYYTDTLAFAWLAAALGGLVAMAALQRVHVRHMLPYVVLGVAIWFCALESGVHPTIAAVAIGLLTPAHPFQEPAVVSAEAIRIANETADEPDDPDADAGFWRRLAWLSREAISPLTRVEHSLHEWSSFLVLPIFALANAGIALDADSLEAAAETPIALAVALGLVLGKTIGITLGAAIAVRLGLSVLPAGVRWAHVVGVAALAGIGFTVSLFIAGLAYTDPSELEAAKIGILGGSIVAALIGLAALLAVARQPGSAGRRAPDTT